MRNSDELRNRAEQVRQSISRPCPDRPPPAENGRRIGTIERSADEQIRVNWSECEGYPYINIRLWKCDRSGQWWPDGKRGISVRIREMVSFAAAIATALDLTKTSQDQWRASRANRPTQSLGTAPIPEGRTDPAPPPGNGSKEFDEFATG